MTDPLQPEVSRVKRARAAVATAGRTAYRYGRRFAVSIGIIVAVVAFPLFLVLARLGFDASDH